MAAKIDRKDWMPKNQDKSARKGKMQERQKGKNLRHKFQQVVIQTLAKKGETDDDTEPEETGAVFEMPEEVGISLNLSKRNMKEFPEALLERMQNVQYLYLEGNNLVELPQNFFKPLNSLKWLDLRNNSLIALPAVGLKNHPCLEVILLQGNRIRNLPVELATIPTLKGLQTTGNPITNVPYDVIAEGFQGVMKHLQKLYSQDEILLPVSDTIVVKPSTSQDETSLGVNEPTDSELRTWDLDKLSQWRQFIKKKSRKPKDPEVKHHTMSDKADSQHTKISVSVRSHPKVPSKPQPFRCGVYNRNRHRLTSSALHYSKLRKSRLGYKRKPITVAMIQEKARKEAYKARVRETLEKQARKIQRMRDKDVLKSWREHAKLTKEQIKLLDNYQQYPSRNFANKTPFDVDPEFLNMLNRVDLYKSLKEYDNRSKRNKKPTIRITALDLERQMNEIMAKLQQLDTNDDGDDNNKSPRTKQSHVCNKMHKIMDIQKTLRNLQTLNSSMNGIIPIIKPKSSN